MKRIISNCITLVFALLVMLSAVVLSGCATSSLDQYHALCNGQVKKFSGYGKFGTVECWRP